MRNNFSTGVTLNYYDTGSESHFKVVVVSDVFDGLPLIKVRQIEIVSAMILLFPATQISDGYFEAGTGWWSSCTVYTGMLCMIIDDNINRRWI